MASRRRTVMPSSLKDASSDAKSSKGASNAGKASSSGAAKKPATKASGTVVKSRYLQSTSEKSSLSKSNSLTSESIMAPPRPASPKPSGVKPKVGTPPRRSLAPQAIGMSMMSREATSSVLGKSMLQSTFSDGHCFRPDFDISVIKDKTIMENPSEGDRNPEDENRILEMHTFLLAYLTAKMECETAKFKTEAEARLLHEMEEEEALRCEVHEKKCQYLLMEKRKLVNELLDLQISALTPVVEASKQFTKDYKSFATAVDTTRHELPVKNFYIDGDRQEFLGKAEACLKETEELLRECTEGNMEDNTATLGCLKEMKMASGDIGQQISGTFSELVELSSLVCRHTIQIQQATEEEQLGTARTLELFCPNG